MLKLRHFLEFDKIPLKGTGVDGKDNISALQAARTTSQHTHTPLPPIMIGRERAVRVAAPQSAQVSLPIRVYLRYGTHHRMGPTGGRLDSDSDELDFPYAEAIMFHRDVFKTSRLIITRGRSADVGSVYSSTLCTFWQLSLSRALSLSLSLTHTHTHTQTHTHTHTHTLSLSLSLSLLRQFWACLYVAPAPLPPGGSHFVRSFDCRVSFFPATQLPHVVFVVVP